MTSWPTLLATPSRRSSGHQTGYRSGSPHPASFLGSGLLRKPPRKRGKLTGRPSGEAGLRIASGIPDRPGDDTKMAKQPAGLVADRRALALGAGPARLCPALQPASPAPGAGLEPPDSPVGLGVVGPPLSPLLRARASRRAAGIRMVRVGGATATVRLPALTRRFVLCHAPSPT